MNELLNLIKSAERKSREEAADETQVTALAPGERATESRSEDATANGSQMPGNEADESTAERIAETETGSDTLNQILDAIKDLGELVKGLDEKLEKIFGEQ